MLVLLRARSVGEGESGSAMETTEQPLFHASFWGAVVVLVRDRVIRSHRCRCRIGELKSVLLVLLYYSVDYFGFQRF
jgi:hypothetical protein